MGQKILVAEDDGPVRHVIVELLQAEGHHVTEADDGEACLKVLGNELFDLLVLDLMMPKIDGFGVILKIRQAELHTGKHIPILCLTGVYSGEFQSTCYRLGGDAFVEKPFSRDALMGKVQELLDARKEPDPVCTTELPVFDYQGTLRKFNGMAKVVSELLGLFSIESAERMAILLGAHEEGLLSEVSVQAHSLKSISGTIGAQRMSHYAGRLEEAAEQGQQDIVTSLVPLLRVELEEVSRQIKQVG